MQEESKNNSGWFARFGSKPDKTDDNQPPANVNEFGGDIPIIAPASVGMDEDDQIFTASFVEIAGVEPHCEDGEHAVGLPEKFIIPTEDEDDILNEVELDMDGEMGLRIRKATRTEFFKMCPAGVFSTYMLPYKPNPDAMDEMTYWVTKELRGKIINELRMIKYYPCYSCASKRLFIMPVKTSDTDWYRSLEVLFKQPPEFFETYAIRIKAEKELGRYRIMYRQDDDPVVWPVKSTAELVTDALGFSNIISSSDHPIYQELVSGLELK